MGLEGVHPLDAIGENFAVNIAAGGLAGVLCGLGENILLRFFNDHFISECTF